MGQKEKYPWRRGNRGPRVGQEACGDSLPPEGKVMCAGKELSQSADKCFSTGS